MTALNGSKPPAPVYVVLCPRCQERRRLPDRVPGVWGFTCRACGVDVEINLTNWKREA